MLYLISQYALPLLIAALLGLLIGWLTCGRVKRPLWSGWVPVGVLAFVIGLFIAVLKLLPGRFGLWLDTALLFVVAYILGCCLGCWLRRLLRPESVDTKPSVVTVQTPLSPVMPLAPVSEPKPILVPPAVKAVVEAPITPEPVIAVPEPIIPVPEPVISVVASPPALSTEPTRPVGLAAPRGNKPDDLKLIKGVGRVLEKKLNEMGIWHFDQIVTMTDAELTYVSSASGFPGRAFRENWRGEASLLAQGVETDHAKAVKAGKVPSSLANPDDAKKK
jgi:predicted flap endonuclease-1-like 5' DNA nuclease